MKLLKPAWINHEGHPIFSVDIHPDESRFATGGQGIGDAGRIIIWNMGPLIEEQEEHQENVPKLLCQMDNHIACVNCVRWSVDGKFLASAGDDKVIMIWQIARYGGSNANFGGSVNVEMWRCVASLRGHSGDILDLGWSPLDDFLASCSVDNTIRIWNTAKWPELTATLEGHTGLVKGVSWDPIGKYIASQSDDKTLKVWRTRDWKEETTVTEPFAECGGTTHVLRLNWSPDGQHLVSAHAMNNRGSTAQIIEREDWKTQKDFVGHRKAITCVRFHPCLLTKGSAGASSSYCCLAVGSRDRSLSIWLTYLKRPLVVVHELFSNSILDISWSKKGQRLLTCSWDGSVAFCEFDEHELGKPLSPQETELSIERLYGKPMKGSATDNLLIEDVEFLKARQERERKQTQSNQNGSNESGSKLTAGDSRSSTSSRLTKGPTDKQIETRLADGRRRITPLYIPPPTDYDGIPIPFNSQQTTFSSSTEARTKILIEKRDEESAHSNLSQLLADVKEPPTTSQQQSNKSPSQTQVTPNKVQTADAVPVKPSAIKSLTSSSKRKDKDREKEETPPPPPAKRKKPGRPPLFQAVQKSTTNLPQPGLSANVLTKERVGDKDETRSVLSHFQLPALRIEKKANLTIVSEAGKPKLTLEVENSIKIVNNQHICALRLFSQENEKQWEVVLSSKIRGLAGCEYLVCVTCEDNTLSIFSTSTGRRLQSPIVLNAPVSRLNCSSHYLLVITVKSSLWLWDFSKHTVLVKNESLVPLFQSNSTNNTDVSISNTGITDNGSPLISLSAGRSFVFDVQFSCWSVISNSNDLLNYCCDLKPAWAREPSSYPLSTVQSTQRHMMRSAHNAFSANSSLQQVATLSYIDQQLAASFVVGSSKEYRHWLLALAQHLTSENYQTRLRELCLYLLGPVYRSPSSKWETTILGNDKHDLLNEVLSIMTSNLRLQRLYKEFKDQLNVNALQVK